MHAPPIEIVRAGFSVTLSLIVFNPLFALQNGLDIIFLWSGAPLPAQSLHRPSFHQAGLQSCVEENQGARSRQILPMNFGNYGGRIAK